MLRTAVVALAVVACAATASADVKMVAQMSGRMMGRTPSGETVTYIKGARMRTDQTMGGNQLSTIMNVESGELISLNHKSKEFEIWNVADSAKAMQDAEASGVDVKITPNGTHKEIAGYQADGYDLTVTVKSQAAEGMAMTVTISGPAYLSPEAPGAKEYAAFYSAAAEKGYFFGDPRAARTQAGNARGMMALYRTMAEKGLPLESRHVIKLSGDGPTAGLFARTGGAEINSVVTSVSNDPLSDELFAVPAGYTRARSTGTLSLSSYASLRDGMTYAQAVGVVGFRGTESAKAGGITTYTWQDRQGGGTISATFQDDLLTSKAQSGLK